MSITLDAPATPTPPARAAAMLAAAARSSLSEVARARASGKGALWGVPKRLPDGTSTLDRAATPDAILSELSEAAQVQIMLGDVVARVLLALREADPVAAFVTSSPVPATERVDFKDASGNVVDLSPELGALLSKMGSVASVDVVQR